MPIQYSVNHDVNLIKWGLMGKFKSLLLYDWLARGQDNANPVF